MSKEITEFYLFEEFIIEKYVIGVGAVIAWSRQFISSDDHQCPGRM
jgi:hypothetical protein